MQKYKIDITDTPAFKKTCLAIENVEIDKLLLGENKYLISWAHSDMYDRGVKANLDYIHTCLLDYKEITNSQNLIFDLTQALFHLCQLGTPESLYIVAAFIKKEAFYRNSHKDSPPLQNLNLNDIAEHLKRRVWFKRDILINEQYYFGGQDFDEGVYGCLKSFSKLSEEEGGPGFI